VTSIILNPEKVLRNTMNDDDCLEEVTIIVFPPMPGIGIIEEDPLLDEEESCGDTSVTQVPVRTDPSSDTIVMKLGVKDPMIRVQQLLGKAKEKYGDSICIRVASYDSKEGVEEAVEWLNAALRGSGDSTVLDKAGFSSFIGSSAPVFSINNRLSFVGMIPNESQFLSRVGASLRIKSQ